MNTPQICLRDFTSCEPKTVRQTKAHTTRNIVCTHNIYSITRKIPSDKLLATANLCDYFFPHTTTAKGVCVLVRMLYYVPLLIWKKNLCSTAIHASGVCVFACNVLLRAFSGLIHTRHVFIFFFRMYEENIADSRVHRFCLFFLLTTAKKIRNNNNKNK